MAKWERLYHDRVAPLFQRGLYWPMLARCERETGEFVFSSVPLGDDLPGYCTVCRAEKQQLASRSFFRGQD